MIKIALKRIENVVLMKVLEQGEEIKRSNFGWKPYTGLKIWSSEGPYLVAEAIYIRGSDRKLDNNIVSKDFCTEEQAIEYYDKVKMTIEQYNSHCKSNAPKTMEEWEVIG